MLKKNAGAKSPLLFFIGFTPTGAMGFGAVPKNIEPGNNQSAKAACESHNYDTLT